MERLRRIDRSIREAREQEMLAPAAALSAKSRGRHTLEEPDLYRTAFERDRDRIVHSKAFRRLKHKTQVFINPDGDHVVTRLTHTLQVTQIGRSIARALALNEDLTEAICLGHDVGHSPFGHIGEEALTPYGDGDWLHAEHSVRVLSVLEPLNLTWETLDGIGTHSWRIEPPPNTAEGYICRFADRIAYLSHDVSDAIRATILRPDALPVDAVATFGAEPTAWIATMIDAVIDESMRQGFVTMDPHVQTVMNGLREFMFERVYLRPEAETQKQQAIAIIRDLVDHYAAHPDDIPASYKVDDAPVLTQAIDYVSGMTDRFALRDHERLTPA